MEQVGVYLRSQRERCGMSAAQCAAALGVGETSIYRIESGRVEPRASLLLRYAALVGASGDRLMELLLAAEGMGRCIT